MSAVSSSLRSGRRNCSTSAKIVQKNALFEPLESRRLLSAAVASVEVGSGLTAGATDLGAVKLKSGRSIAGVVGATSTDTVYKVELASELNLGMTLSKLMEKDQLYLFYQDGTMVNTGWQSSKAALSVSQHLSAGTYYVDVHHGFVADYTTGVGAAKVKVTPVKKYHIKTTDGFVLAVKGLKADSSIPPQEVIKPTEFSAAFGATGAQAEPTISASLAQQSGYTGFKAFSTADGYQLWGTAGPSPDDVIQQALGDCYYMSIISTMARDNPGLIEQDIVTQGDGSYLVKFQSNGQEVDEQVDDMFPVNAAGNTVFAGIPSDKDIWVAVLEKAWCYFRPKSTEPGSYDGIQGGLPSESLAAFGSTDATDAQSNAYTTAPQLLSAIADQLNAGKIVDVCTQQPQNGQDPLPSGMFTGHAYSVVKVDVASNSIEVRNPWATNTQAVSNDGSGGYKTVTGDQLVNSIQLFDYGTLTTVTPNPNVTPTPNPTPTPTPDPTTTTTTVQTIAEDLGPDSFQTNGGSNYDFFEFTANSSGQVDILIDSTSFIPQLLIAQQGSNGWATVSSDANADGSATAEVKFTATPGVTYGIGVFVSGTTDTGAYTLTMNGDLSSPVQGVPSSTTGSVTGVVYNDANADRTQNTGEVGLSGVTVFIDANGTGQYTEGDPTASTNSNGSYTFTGLQPGTYTVYVKPADGLTQTAPAGNAGLSVTVTAGAATTASGFGEAVQSGGGISGTVYSDDNQNGQQDGSEAGLAGWYVYIDLGNTGQYVHGDPYAQTDASGHYTFQGLTAGSYTLRVYPQTGYTTTQGSTGLVATVTADHSVTGGDFGESKPAGTISGVVYGDANDDATQDAGEAGLSGWQVYIDLGNTGSFVSGDPTTTTDANGTYSFTGLAAGQYIIRLVGQTGYTTNEGSLGWTATAVAGETVNGGSFGESQATGDLSGTVYFDTNRNGQQDGNEYGISNWAVYIDLDNSGVYNSNDPYVITDSYGGYSFTDLAPGTYIVRAYVYTGTRWVASEGSAGWSATVQGDQTEFGGNFGEHY